MAKIKQNDAIKWLPTEHADSDEKVIMFLRRHWFILFTKYLFMLILALIPIGLYWFLATFYPSFLDNPVTYAITVLFASLYYLFVWISVYVVFIDYYLDVWIITTHRIIDREQRGLFHVIISEQNLDQIQDVSSNVQGVIPTLLDYGNVLIQSAAAKNLFHFKQIPDPDLVVQEVIKLAQNFRKNHQHDK